MIDTAELIRESKVKQRTSTQPSDLDVFLKEWDTDYTNRIKDIPLFNSKLTSAWTMEQRQYFVKIFYHVRGHFYKFLWFFGCHAPTKDIKAIVLHNLEEEFGEHSKSHEQLYMLFAQDLHADITAEFVAEKSYLPEVRVYNETHLAWLERHQDWASRMGAFSAYERLDNIDYNLLYKLAINLEVSASGLAFFKVHSQAGHFERTLDVLRKYWLANEQHVRNGFQFIASHQITMWERLSESIENYEKTKPTLVKQVCRTS